MAKSGTNGSSPPAPVAQAEGAVASQETGTAAAEKPKANATADSGRVTPKSVASDILSAIGEGASRESASKVRGLLPVLHSVYGSMPPAIERAVMAYYRDPSDANAKAVAQAIKAEKFEG